jgi:hypothetical protein
VHLGIVPLSCHRCHPFPLQLLFKRSTAFLRLFIEKCLTGCRKCISSKKFVFLVKHIATFGLELSPQSNSYSNEIPVGSPRPVPVRPVGLPAVEVLVGAVVILLCSILTRRWVELKS